MPIKSWRKLRIQDLILIEVERFEDERGFFEEIVKNSEIKKIIGNYDFVQVNMSFSKRGVIRGLHYQLPPSEQGKLIMVIKGKIFDVAVDIRKSSPNFKNFETVILSDAESKLFWIPPGFAHGFQALEDSYVLYFVTKEYDKERDRSIYPFDAEIGIEWPLKEYIISEKDKKAPLLKHAEIFE